MIYKIWKFLKSRFQQPINEDILFGDSRSRKIFRTYNRKGRVKKRFKKAPPIKSY